MKEGVSMSSERTKEAKKEALHTEWEALVEELQAWQERILREVLTK